ncbi:MFS transporter [Amycolatopsis sp. H20-H5]|uniref:MFS transporter n=1 Tax=Amycolatopsis sp. H20-H5 TaxID=3046309 RepID=UPI002DC0401D|nr:MFS transporter [Amycolatopsis sp. H20-H5]MEC3975064.1 MFS transporter [Amycolatopsis sp. H20-H5]
MTLMFFARLPMTAMGVTLTLYVVQNLGRGYGEAGLVGTATMLGSALGSPLVGRMIDKYGLRPVVAVCGVASTTFWISAPHLSYLWLLLVALPGGLLAIPSGSIARQVLAALVPESQRRAAYSLDSVSVEASFMIGPSVGILAITQLPASTAFTGVGVCFGLTAVLLYLTNLPIRGEDDSRPKIAGPRPALRTWLSGRLIATLLVAAGALFTLVGTEVAALASLRATGDVGWTGLVITVMCVASVIGGIVHGAVAKSLTQTKLMLLLTLLVLPVGLFDQPWWLLMIALFPTNLVCAPTLAATTESVSKLAPATVRGEAMGLQDSATRLGLAVGSPVVGFAIDHSSPGWGFVAAGLGGLVLAGLGLIWKRRSATAGRVPALTS